MAFYIVSVISSAVLNSLVESSTVILFRVAWGYLVLDRLRKGRELTIWRISSREESFFFAIPVTIWF
ncbi:hypothetical protein OAH29_05215, partial [Akkermansiaceae bacterium]|nr:hypothetical protein [Akkermansiaceae bacterium]